MFRLLFKIMLFVLACSTCVQAKVTQKQKKELKGTPQEQELKAAAEVRKLLKGTQPSKKQQKHDQKKREKAKELASKRKDELSKAIERGDQPAIKRARIKELEARGRSEELKERGQRQIQQKPSEQKSKKELKQDRDKNEKKALDGLGLSEDATRKQLFEIADDKKVTAFLNNSDDQGNLVNPVQYEKELEEIDAFELTAFRKVQREARKKRLEKIRDLSIFGGTVGTIGTVLTGGAGAAAIAGVVVTEDDEPVELEEITVEE